MFRTRETRLGPGALSTPGTAVPATARCNPWPPHAALQRPVPVTPVLLSVPGSPNNGGISKGSLAFTPPSLSLACAPRTVRGPSGFSLSSAPGRAGPNRARQGGNEPQALPGVTSSAPLTSFDALTHRERPHVALAVWVAIRPRPRSFTEVRSPCLTCTVGTREPARTRQGRAFNPRARSCSSTCSATPTAVCRRHGNCELEAVVSEAVVSQIAAPASMSTADIRKVHRRSIAGFPSGITTSPGQDQRARRYRNPAPSPTRIPPASAARPGS
jgi:hypothetical protein